MFEQTEKKIQKFPCDFYFFDRLFALKIRIDFTITKDEGHFNHWRYSVVYKERLSHWPYWINVADADFEVKKLDQSKNGEYLVASTHRTCFAAGLYCCKCLMNKVLLQINQLDDFN